MSFKKTRESYHKTPGNTTAPALIFYIYFFNIIHLSQSFFAAFRYQKGKKAWERGCLIL